MPRGFSRACQGCWTCRVRHRKCDEVRPECNECTTRRIPCHGYSSTPPEWTKDEGLLQLELQSIKRAVKENFRQGKLRKRPSAPARGALPDAADRRSSRPSPKLHKKTASTNQLPAAPAKDTSFKDAKNIVYYLDYVFPRQYPYYVDNPDHGGRGWLLWLLMKSAPLRHATLTLAALHQYFSSPLKTKNHEEQLLYHHSKALKELRLALSRRPAGGFVDRPEDWVEFVACTLTLISFQIFQGGLSDWDHHLTALNSVIGELTGLELDASLKLSDNADFELLQGINAAQKFLVAEMLWFDILACIATGTPPFIPYREWLDKPGIDMSSLMGCQNWAMSAIGDAAVIDSQVDELAPEALQAQISELEKQIRLGLDVLNFGEKAESNPTSRAITRIYATGTLVQLCCIAGSSNTSSRNIHDAVSSAIEAIKQLPAGVTLRGIPWPLCMAGAAAEPDQQAFFEELFQGILSQPGSNFGNCETVFRIIKHCWYRRSLAPTEIWGPRRAMIDMKICALLI